MPKGPKGERRPADVIGNAVMVMKIATGEIVDTADDKKSGVVIRGHAGGLIGGEARAKKLSAERRKEIAQKAAKVRWKRQK